MIFTDHFYERGSSHQVCQDYALSEQDKDNAIFVISDGCGSSKNSEIGSMLLAHALKTAYHLNWYEGIDINRSIGNRVINEKLRPIYARKITDFILKETTEIARKFEINLEDLYATLLLGAYEKKSNTFSIWAQGDGFFVIMYEDKTYDIIEIEYENNSPYYILYDNTTSSLESYIKNCGGKHSITTYSYDQNNVRTYTSELFRDYPMPYSLKINSNVSGILGFSDGVKSFKEHFSSIIPRCINFKNINNTFIQRRIKRLLKEKSKQDDLPYDDFSCAGIIKK